MIRRSLAVVPALLAGILAVAAGCQHVPAGVTMQDYQAVPVPDDQRPWRTVQTEHFELFAQLDDANTAGLARILEQSRSAILAAAWPLRSRLPASPVRVIAVWGLGHFGAAPSDAFGGLASWSVGVRELGRSNLIMLNLDSEQPQYAGFIAAHELTHLTGNLLEVDLPRWLHEGLAAYFEAMVFEPERVTVGAVTAGRLQSLRQVPRVSVARLFEWPVSLEEPQRYSIFTTNSFLLVHYLMSESHQRFRDFQRRLLEGAAWQVAWNELYGPVDQVAMDEALARYWQRRRLPTRDHDVTFAPSPRVRTVPVSQADVHALRALLYQRAVGPMSQADRQGRSEDELSRSLALDPVNRLALEAGWPYFSPQEARVRARSTWQARPHDWRAAVLAARAADAQAAVDILEKTRRWHSRHSYLEGALALAYWGVQRHAEARELARLAVEREPNDPFLLGVYGQCLIAKSDCEAGREPIAQALAAAEAGKRFPYDLGWLKRVCGLE